MRAELANTGSMFPRAQCTPSARRQTEPEVDDRAGAAPRDGVVVAEVLGERRHDGAAELLDAEGRARLVEVRDVPPPDG